MKVNDKVVNIDDIFPGMPSKKFNRPIKSGTTGVVKKIIESDGVHLTVYLIKFPDADMQKMYKYEVVKLR